MGDHHELFLINLDFKDTFITSMVNGSSTYALERFYDLVERRKSSETLEYDDVSK